MLGGDGSTETGELRVIRVVVGPKDIGPGRIVSKNGVAVGVAKDREEWNRESLVGVDRELTATACIRSEGVSARLGIERIEDKGGGHGHLVSSAPTE